MNYEALVPSRELCEELARLGICQDGAELLWNCLEDDVGGEEWDLQKYKIGDEIITAPTLPRMLEELPENYKSGWLSIEKCEGWIIRYWDDDFVQFEVFDKHLPNAVARALIAVKEASGIQSSPKEK